MRNLLLSATVLRWVLDRIETMICYSPVSKDSTNTGLHCVCCYISIFGCYHLAAMFDFTVCISHMLPRQLRWLDVRCALGMTVFLN